MEEDHVDDPQVHQETTFPQEVIDYIIDFHYKSPAILQILALVSSACLPAARRHLFEEVIVSDHQHGHHSLGRFQILLQAGPTVTTAIRTLYFISPRGAESSIHSIPLSTIIAASRRFPLLQTLGMISAQIKDDSPILSEPSYMPKPLQVLIIHAPSTKPCSRTSIRTILRQFSSILTLQLEVNPLPVFAEEMTAASDADTASKVRISNVTLSYGPGSTRLIEVFIEVADPDGVEVLTLEHPIISLGLHPPLLKAFASSLTAFTILDCRRIYHIDSSPMTDISFCRTLTHLNMIIFDNPTEDSISKMLAVVPSSPTVTELQITFYYCLQAPSETPTEEEFSAILSLPVWKDIRGSILGRLPALLLVSIHFSHRVTEHWSVPGAFKSAIKESFALPARCTLQFQANYMRSS